MAYDTVTSVTDDLHDNLATYSNEKKTAIDHLMTASAYAAYSRTQSMTGNVTLTDSDFPIQSFSPTAARDLTLPSVASTNHPFYVFNRSGTYAITIKNASAVVLCVLQPYGSAIIDSDGANLWSVTATNERETAYKFTPTVVSNDLILTLTHMDGSTPTTSRPLWFRIGNSWRAVTAALSRTLADGTNWFDASGTKFGTLAIDYFAYVVWDSNSSAVGLTFARIPYAGLVSDFSSTTTNEKYCAGYSDFTSTDEVKNIGRFEATLSSTIWTVPTYTPANLICEPTFETDWRYWLCAPSQGYSSNPSATVYQYKFVGRDCFIAMREGTNGTSNTTSIGVYPLPFTAKTITNGLWFGFAFIVNNGTTDAAGYCYVQSAGTTISFVRSADAAYTASGGRRVNLQSPFLYPIA